MLARHLSRSDQLPGVSAGSINPCWRQPFTRSQVRGRATARSDRRFRLKVAAAFQPSNHAPEDAISSRTGGGDAVPLAPVLAHIQEDVGERVPHLARRPQHAQVVAPEQHRTLAPEDPIHRARESRRHRFHPARQGFLPAASTTMCRWSRWIEYWQTRNARARTLRAGWTGTPGRSADCAARERRDARAASRAKDSATGRRPLHVMDRRAGRSGLAPGTLAASAVTSGTPEPAVSLSHNLNLAMFSIESTIND